MLGGSLPLIGAGSGGISESAADALIAAAENSKTIVRGDATTGVEPTSGEWAAPDEGDVAIVLLSDGTREVWSYASSAWSLTQTIASPSTRLPLAGGTMTGTTTHDGIGIFAKLKRSGQSFEKWQWGLSEANGNLSLNLINESTGATVNESLQVNNANGKLYNRGSAVFSREDKASQAQAWAATDDDTVLTPLRGKDLVDNQLIGVYAPLAGATFTLGSAGLLQVTGPTGSTYAMRVIGSAAASGGVSRIGIESRMADRVTAGNEQNFILGMDTQLPLCTIGSGHRDSGYRYGIRFSCLVESTAFQGTLASLGAMNVTTGGYTAHGSVGARKVENVYGQNITCLANSPVVYDNFYGTKVSLDGSAAAGAIPAFYGWHLGSTMANLPTAFWGLYSTHASCNHYLNGKTGFGVTPSATGATIQCSGAVKVGSFTVGTVPSASAMGAGSIIYVSNESGGAVHAGSDGTDWRRFTDRAVIS